MLREVLTTILTDFPAASIKPFAGNVTAKYIRENAKQAIRESLGSAATLFTVNSSAGAGNWAAVPWIAIFYPKVTSNATSGYYVVYLFSSKEPVVYLSFNQGTTSVREKHKRNAFQVLQKRAAAIRASVSDLIDRFDSDPIELGSDNRLPKDYEAGHAFGRKYALNALPSEAELQADVQAMGEAYIALAARGGIIESAEATSEVVSTTQLTFQEQSLPLQEATPLVEKPLPGKARWWLNINPDYWRVSDFTIGQEQSYTTHNEKGNKRNIYRYFKEVQPGDLLIGYETSPIKRVK